MCLIAIDWKTNPHWPLVLIGNRDEFHARPTDPATFWTEAPAIIAGRDLTAGGTWLGVHANGRFAAVTNYREKVEPPPNARSRGHLVGDFLRGAATPAAFMANIAADANRYAGFNLFTGDRDTLMYFCNRNRRAPRRLEAGRYALGNATLDTPWPKVERMREAFANELGAHPKPGFERLLTLLRDQAGASDAELPDTGLARERERLLSAPFVVSPSYGTRASSVLTKDDRGRVTFVERGFDPEGNAMETRAFSFLAASGALHTIVE
jgi:uncharacterized protein with NRDE domain